MRTLLALFSLGLAAIATAATEITPVPPTAVKRVATVQVRVAPERADWTYSLGEQAVFRIHVTADNHDLPNVPVRLAYGPEMMKETIQEVTVPAGGLLVSAGTLNEPGFLRLTATTEVAGHSYKGAATAAFAPERILPTQKEPTDFDGFWDGVKAQLAATPLEAKLTPLPDSSTADVNVYHVALRLPGGSWQGPARFYGILSEPTKPGKYPVVLRVPGAGVRPYKGDIATAAKGVITFEVGVHGIPVNMPQGVYDDLLAGPLQGYWTYNLDNRDTFYYRRVIQGCLRSVDFLVSRGLFDGKNVVVSGASQGGMLAIITAALHPRVTGLTATHPAFCDVSGPLHGRAGGWPHPFRGDVNTGTPSVNATEAKIATAQYYDVVNFAKRVKVPGFYIWGYNDDVCPPTSVYAAFNSVKAPKEAALTLEMAHNYTPEQWDATQGWIDRFLGLK